MKHLLSTLFLALLLFSCTPEQPEPNEPTPTTCSTADFIIADLSGDTLVYVTTEPTDSSIYLTFSDASTSRLFLSDGLMLYVTTFETEGDKVKGTHAMLYPITEGEDGIETNIYPPWEDSFESDSSSTISTSSEHALIIHYSDGNTRFYDRLE